VEAVRGSVSDMLVRHWEAQGLMLSHPASAQQIAEFESAHGVKLTDDFGDYLRRVNGLVDIGWSGVDRNGFAFWPLRQMRNAQQYDPDGQVAKSLKATCYVFADYRERSWAYAIDLGLWSLTRGQIVHVATLQPKVVASSFTDFVSLYLGDSRALYPDISSPDTNAVSE
jgi:hypothetical protein